MGDFRGSRDPRNHEIVHSGEFCEVIFFCISPKNLLGDFFDSLSCALLGNVLRYQCRFHSEINEK